MAAPVTMASSDTVPTQVPPSSWPLTISPICATSPPVISIPASSAPRARPSPSAAKVSGSVSPHSTKSSIASGSEPTHTMSFAFIATQSMPIVSNRSSCSATTIFVPTVSVDIARPVRSSRRITLA